MSGEAAVADAPSKAVDQNTQAAQDTEKLLAELQGSTEPAPPSDGDKEADVVGSEKKESSVRKREQSDRYERKDRRDGGRGGRGGGRGRGGFKDYRNNVKSDLTSQEPSDDPVAIRKQVEFYFSDSNLPMDKFLFGKVGGSANNSVELSVIHSFKRMRHFQPFEAIVEALKESTFLELTDDNTCVRRKEPLPEALNDGSGPDAIRVFEDKAMPRSVYVKGFGEEAPSTQFDIEAFFAPYGPTNAIRLRRSDTKLFKGSVFAEFESEELAKKFLELDPKPKYKGKDLQIMSKKEYCDKKVDDIKAGKIKANDNSKFNRRDDKRGGRDFKRKRDDEDNRDWRERREHDRKNGFRDDKRRGGHRDRGSRDKGRRDSREHQIEKDDRGIPVVKPSTAGDERSNRDSARADALAKARAAVEAENKKQNQETAEGVEAAKQENAPKTETETAHKASEGVQADSETAGKKRAREEDVEAGRDAKKVNVKADV